MEKLAKLEQEHDLRTVWPREAQDFSAWLEKNMDLLSDAIGIRVEPEKRESPVGDFRVDIYAREAETGKSVIIENQLEETDHKHLGQIITYAAGANAAYIIWIVKSARDDHQKAIQWLNEHTDANINFFLLEIELWRIGTSQLAPKFNLVEEPNNWVKQQNLENVLSEKAVLNQNFWQEFQEYAKAQPDMKVFTFKKARPMYNYDFSTGNSKLRIRLTMSVQKNEITAGIYIHGDEDLSSKLQDKVLEMEKLLDEELSISKGEKDTRIYAIKEENVSDESRWLECFAWYCAKAPILYEIIHSLKN